MIFSLHKKVQVELIAKGHILSIHSVAKCAEDAGTLQLWEFGSNRKFTASHLAIKGIAIFHASVLTGFAVPLTVRNLA